MICTRKFLVGLCVLAIAFVPVLSVGQDSLNVWVQAQQDARADAERDVMWPLWLGCGCLFLYFAPLGALIVVSSPPADRLICKSAEYTMAYSSEYKSKLRGLQVRWSLIGCFGTGVIGLGAIAILAATDPEACEPDCGNLGCEPTCTTQ